MINAINVIKQPVFPVVASTSVAVVGLAIRSCHAAGGSLLVPVCGGEPMVLALGNSSVVHCAGCYVAAAGLVAACASVFNLALKRKKY